MKKIKLIFSFILVLILAFSLISTAFATTVVGSGFCGATKDPYDVNGAKNATWTLTDDGVLTIQGTGETKIYFIGGGIWTPPWLDLNVPITKIIVGEGIEYLNAGILSFGDGPHSIPLRTILLPSTLKVIGVRVFPGCQDLTDVYIPEGVTLIGNGAFAYSALQRVYIPSTIEEFGVAAFRNCHDLKNVYFGGTEAQWEALKNGEYGDYIQKSQIMTSNPTIHFNAKDDNPLMHLAPGNQGQTPDNPTDEPSNWAKAEVSAAISAGLVPENLQKNYTKPVSRGEVARMFINLLEKSTGKSIDTLLAEKGVSLNPDAFTDTADKAVLAANALGIIKGVGGGKFSPNGTLTRAQIAAIINREATVLGVKTTGYTHSFTDVKGHWVDSELGWPVHAGIINGVGNNRFAPNSELTTEQAIAITYRALGALS